MQKISVFINVCDIYAHDFSDMIKVIDAYIRRQEGEVNADEARRNIVRSFSTISDKTQYHALAEYAASLKLYYLNEKTRFTELYQQSLQRSSASRPGSSRIVSTGERVGRRKRSRTVSESSLTSVPASASSIATGPENNLNLSCVKEIVTTVAKSIFVSLDAGKKIKLTDYKLIR